MIFRKKPKTPTREQLMAQKPVKLVDAEMTPSEQGGKLTVPMQPPKFARWLGAKSIARDKTFEFDSLGLFVWQQLDGRTSVQQLIRRLAKQYNLNLREAEASTLLFLQMLTKRGLVGVPRREKGKR